MKRVILGRMGFREFVTEDGAMIFFLIKVKYTAEEEKTIFRAALEFCLFLRISLVFLVSPSFQNLARTRDTNS